MFTIAIFPNVDKKNANVVLQRILGFYRQRQVKILLPMDEALYFGCETYGVQNIEDYPIDIGISLGGDGTLLGVCRRLHAKNVPVCGINIGTLGFLADIELTEIENKLDKIISGEYYIEERMMIEGFVQCEEQKRFLGGAINDIVITKGGVARMLQLGLSINGVRVTDYKADGVIVSTPTGSTAYSLSAGGPIINPRVRALLLTPICPHTFNIRPMVIDENDDVHIHIAAVHQDIIVTLDGQESFRLLPGDEVVVRKAAEAAKIVKFKDKEYYQTIRSKLWGNS